MKQFLKLLYLQEEKPNNYNGQKKICKEFLDLLEIP